MPALYALNFLIFFVQFWVDKWLIFNFYKKTAHFTRYLSTSVVNLLPLAVIVHALFGLMIFSYQVIFKSDHVNIMTFGNNSQYFNKDRLGQVHVVVFVSVNVLIVMLFMFESTFVHWWRLFYSGCAVKCGRCCAKANGKEYDETDYN